MEWSPITVLATFAAFPLPLRPALVSAGPSIIGRVGVGAPLGLQDHSRRPGDLLVPSDLGLI
jgi:hypothetical protein